MVESVLVVDDEVGITNAMKRILKKDGYRLSAANDAVSALRIMEDQQFDLVISDQRMPNMNGSVLLTEVRRLYPGTSRMLFSGYCDYSALMDAVNDAAIDCFLLKPWIDNELREKIREVLGQKALKKTNQASGALDSNLQNELDFAIRNKQFVNYFQPIINVNTNGIYAAEMLVRWEHPSKGLLNAKDFVYVTKNSQSISEIGINQLEFLLDYVNTFIGRVNISMNVSPLQLQSQQFSKKLEKFCSQLGNRAENFILEITEMDLVSSLDVISKQLRKLKVFGVRIALDDFCTGYSSLDYLRKLPVDILKIDRGFVTNIASDQRSQFIVTSIIELSRKFNTLVIAEGVENTSQANTLKDLGCFLQQGYLYGKPAKSLNE